MTFNPIQVLVRWGIQRGTFVIPKAAKVSHMKSCLLHCMHRNMNGDLDLMQVLVRWGTQRVTSEIPKATKVSHMKSCLLQSMHAA